MLNRNSLLLLLYQFISCFTLHAQLPNPALVGYWHNWNDASAPYIPLNNIDNRYNVIMVSFAVPTSPSDMNMLFVPDGTPPTTFVQHIQALKAQGKKVILSIGGATTSIDVTTSQNKTAFINSLNTLITTYGFDGIDIDIENGASVMVSGGTIANPTSTAQLNLIDAIKQIMSFYRANNAGKKLLLTMAPETAYVVGGQSGYGGIWGGYLPIIHALRDSLDLLHMQLYNSGSMYGIDGNIYQQGTADFIIAMSEALIQGFNTGGGFFTGLPASKIAVGLPACTQAAGGGYTAMSTVTSAINYLRGSGPKPGSYTLLQSGGYPALRGMMTWSINWDAVANCGGAYTYAATYQSIFGSSSPCSGSNLSCFVQSTNTTCGLANGSASVVASGGALPYSYTWSNAATQAALQNLSAATYTVTITDGNGCTTACNTTINNSICPKVTSQTVSNISQTTALVNWPAVSCAAKYRIILKKNGSSTQSTTIINAANTSYTLTNLEPNTTYQVRLRTQCSQNGTVLSQLSPITSFTTLNSQGVLCTAPQNIQVSNVTAAGATVTWIPVPGAIQYNLRYRAAGTATWITDIISNGLANSHVLNTLNPSTAYEFQIRTKCNNNPAEFSPYSATYIFTTNAFRTEEENITAHPIMVYPNPVTDVLHVLLPPAAQRLTVYDILGQVVVEQNVEANKSQVSIDLSDLPAGIYLLSISNPLTSCRYQIIKQ